MSLRPLHLDTTLYFTRWGGENQISYKLIYLFFVTERQMMRSSRLTAVVTIFLRLTLSEATEDLHLKATGPPSLTISPLSTTTFNKPPSNLTSDIVFLLDVHAVGWDWAIIRWSFLIPKSSTPQVRL